MSGLQRFTCGHFDVDHGAIPGNKHAPVPDRFYGGPCCRPAWLPGPTEPTPCTCQRFNRDAKWSEDYDAWAAANPLPVRD
jgi:hypothetical protein